MKKQLSKISTLTLALLSFAAFSQEKIQPCNTYAAMEQAFANNPEARKNYEAAQKQLQMEVDLKAASRSAATVFTVPVVFHVLYECNGQTITDAALITALQEVNDDFARNSSDTNQIVNPFKMSYINSDIHFMLAKKDQFGNCTNGIVRHNNAKTRWDQGTANLGSTVGNSYWPYTWNPTKYLNIYIVTEIIPQGTVTGGGVIVGYTYKPGTWSTQNPHDAIVYDMDFISGSSAGVPKSRSLTHEIGHWLNLSHTFGNTNNPGISCGDDGISDTPITKGEFNVGCPSSFVNSCTQSNPLLAGLSNVQNIMNYSDCPRNFTTGQTNAMRTALGSSISGRLNVPSAQNLIDTDVNGAGLCSPIAEFFTTNCSYTVCKGASLSVKDLSSNGTISSLLWSADNGATVANPTASITSIVFPNIGISNITLSVTNAQGSDTKVRMVTVVDNTPGFGPIQMESFENPGIPTDWMVINPDNDATEWVQANNGAAYDAANSFMVPGLNNPGGNSDILQMPIMDVLNHQTNVFEFAYAYRQMNSTQNDLLKVEGSKDCGGTWQTIYSMSANTMQNGTGGVGTSDFVPAQNEWKTYTLSAHPQWQNYKTSPNVIVRFNFIEGTNGYGNNMYLDAINWSGSLVGINALTKSLQFNMYPNPTTGETNVNFTLSDPASIKVSVVDIMGREVMPLMENKLNAGEQSIVVNKDNTLAPGVYFVNLSFNGAKMSRKLVIN